MGAACILTVCGVDCTQIGRVAELTDERSVTLSDYSVRVEGLPRHATRDDVLEHFNSLYDLSQRSWSAPGGCCGIGAKMPLPVPVAFQPGERRRACCVCLCVLLCLCSLFAASPLCGCTHSSW